MLFKVDPDPDPGKEIEVDPDPDPRRGSKWIRIRIRPNVVDPGGSGSGSETLFFFLHIFAKKNLFDNKFLQEKLIIAFFITRMDKKRTFLA